jgi:hypothetical protein
MPLARYFLYLGGIMLALLFILDAFLPRFPVADKQKPAYVIRIHSDRKWPERVVYDTNLPTIVPAQIAATEAVVPVPAVDANVSATANAREAFAQMSPSAPDRVRLPASKKREATQQRERKIAKRTMPRIVLVARQPHFGWFGNRIW